MNLTVRGILAELTHAARPSPFDLRSWLEDGICRLVRGPRTSRHRVASFTRVGDVLRGMSIAPWEEPFRSKNAVLVCICSVAFVAPTDLGAEHGYARHLADPRWPENNPRLARPR